MENLRETIFELQVMLREKDINLGLKNDKIESLKVIIRAELLIIVITYIFLINKLVLVW